MYNNLVQPVWVALDEVVDLQPQSRHGHRVGDAQTISRLAAAQHGVFSRSQAHDAGFDRWAIRRRLESGMWTRVDDSVYAVSSSPKTWEQKIAAAVISRPEAVLTHITAAHLLGLSGFPRDAPVLLLPRGSSVRSRIARVLETDQFDRIATTIVDGFPVTTIPETILVLARDTSPERLEATFDEALISGVLDLKAMAKTIDREAGRRTPGTPLLRRLTSSRMPTAPSRGSSYLEALLERILHDSRMPLWAREHEFTLADQFARVDVYVPSARLVIEADGRNWHTKSLDFEVDRHRDNALAARGIQVLRFTFEMLTDNPETCLQQILDVCRIRAA